MREGWMTGGESLARGCGPMARVAAAMAAFVLVLAWAGPAAAAEAKVALPEAAKACVACHKPEFVAKLAADGKPLPQHTQVADLKKSVHAELECTDCHSDSDPARPAGTDRKAKEAREYTAAMSSNCRDCHKKEAKKNDTSIHTARLKDGVFQAPVCADCHSAHTVTRKVAARDPCLGCHEKAQATHAKWLPNTRRHLEAVACAMCHAPAGKSMVVLALADRATKKPAIQGEGARDFAAFFEKADTGEKGIDPVELRALLGLVNADSTLPPISLRGRMELVAPADEHGLADNSKARRDCASCHVAQADAFRRVSLAYIDEDGRNVRYPADKEVLTSIFSIDSVREFYVVGGTRIELLDLLLLLAVFGGISMPIGHQLVKRLVGSPAEPHTPPPGDSTNQAADDDASNK